MDIHGLGVHSEAFGPGVIAERSDATITVDFSGTIRRFLYPSCFESYLTMTDPAMQEAVRSELAAVKSALARAQRNEKRRALMLFEQEKAAKAAARKPVRKKKQSHS